MVLFHDIIQIFHLTDGNVRAVFFVIALDSGFIGVAAVNGNRLEDPLRRIAFFRNRSAASFPRCSVSRKMSDATAHGTLTFAQTTSAVTGTGQGL